MKQTELDEWEMYFEFHSIADMIQFLGLCDQIIRQFGRVKISLVCSDLMEIENE